jgi:hypothetical protein
MYAIFFLSIAVTLCALLAIEIIAQRVTAPERTAIEGALHGE